jgi:aspartate/methionine/tyrosine aminotransferase
MDLPVEALTTEGGYFIICDVSKCKPYIPAKYLTTNDYEDPAKGHPVSKTVKHMPNGSIPFDLAFCRWFAVEYGVIFLPASNFYGRSCTTTVCDNHVRVAICKDRAYLEKAI